MSCARRKLALSTHASLSDTYSSVAPSKLHPAASVPVRSQIIMFAPPTMAPRRRARCRFVFLNVQRDRVAPSNLPVNSG